MSLITLLRKLGSRSWPERWLLLRTTLALATMRLAVGLVPFRVIVRLLRLREAKPAQLTGPAHEVRAARTGCAVRSVAAHAPWHSTCLVQALAAAILLRRDGIEATLSLGVAKDADAPEGLIAHAWLRCGDSVVLGETESDRFTELTSLVV
jgi:hypothetical protein